VSGRAPGLALDDAALAALRAGDEAAIAAVLRALLPRVRAWLHRLLGARADLDDAVQDTLTELARALPTFEGRAALTTFAHRIAVRTAYRYFERAPEVALELVPPAADELDPESRAMAREALRRLERCLRRLPAKRRVAFVLCAVEGLEPREAAAIEGVTAFTMRARLMRARAEVERLLAADPYVTALRGGRR
jgi:RNA polymerase sigma-70 factor (ECF subfamily)